MTEGSVVSLLLARVGNVGACRALNQNYSILKSKCFEFTLKCSLGVSSEWTIGNDVGSSVFSSGLVTSSG